MKQPQEYPDLEKGAQQVIFVKPSRRYFYILTMLFDKKFKTQVILTDVLFLI